MFIITNIRYLICFPKNGQFFKLNKSIQSLEFDSDSNLKSIIIRFKKLDIFFKELMNLYCPYYLLSKILNNLRQEHKFSNQKQQLFELHSKVFKEQSCQVILNQESLMN
ncbi:unnamed protein product (macronuclear) [Paramecium tetraurelia]|uniref:Uncharacterized protein n=1 Tax=Paramecium tetraurelia TaxID=5888 RepID=A0DNC3_PARTE|nr:uncharacterized protein GSPATT00018735001 [Paramecium tetraurelia]CAK84540.1 unnamed protein product [Paramecium tetraurelia]|eukprot:XP_001451937.1 hypothetical protein (macronuclear) [Paramecium tetraurelia strain d4-2]